MNSLSIVIPAAANEDRESLYISPDTGPEMDCYPESGPESGPETDRFTESPTAVAKFGQIDEVDIAARFSTVENNRDGNCLFESVAHVLGWDDAGQIRQCVAEYYDSPGALTAKFPADSIERLIQCSIQLENAASETPHQEKIRYDGIYGSVCDLAACALIYGFDAEVYMRTPGQCRCIKAHECANQHAYTMYYIAHPCGTQEVRRNTYSFIYTGCDQYFALVLH